MRNNPRPHDRRWLTRARLPIQVLLSLLLAVTVAAQGRPAEPSVRGEGTLRAMTYNMYVGSEYAGVTNPNLPVFLQAVTNMFLEASASDPAGRVQIIARQIAATMPHLVSLQEVATWSKGPTKDNLAVQFDYLQLLLDALAAQGVQYTLVVSNETWSVTVPSSMGLYVRTSWGVAILARADLKPEHFSFTNVHAATWSALSTLNVPLPALNGNAADCPVALTSSGACVMPMPRGWAYTDVTYRGKQVRFISAHLESGSASRNIRQGNELLNGPANTALPVIVAGDLNCDLSNPSDPKYPTCIGFINAGFVDSWSAANPFEPGNTRNVPNVTIRSDYIFVRGPFTAQTALLVGEEPGDKTASGLYASDHSGVVAKLEPPEQ